MYQHNKSHPWVETETETETERKREKERVNRERRCNGSPQVLQLGVLLQCQSQLSGARMSDCIIVQTTHRHRHRHRQTQTQTQ